MSRGVALRGKRRLHPLACSGHGEASEATSWPCRCRPCVVAGRNWGTRTLEGATAAKNRLQPICPACGKPIDPSNKTAQSQPFVAHQLLGPGTGRQAHATESIKLRRYQRRYVSLGLGESPSVVAGARNH